jgi:hypothetical protein
MATNTYVALDKKTVTSAVASVDFTSIPSGYTDLVLVCSASASTSYDLRLRFNSDSGSNYSYTVLYGTGSAAGSDRGSNLTFAATDYYGVPNTTLGSTNQIINIQNYSNTTTYKTWLARANNAASGVDAIAGLWRSTTAISSISVSYTGSAYTIGVGSTFSLYGIKAEGVSPAAKATGGAIYSDSNYFYHVFASTSTFTPLQSLTADLLVVAGGGGGGSTGTGGGGGAGGILQFSSQSLSATGYTCTVGAGGAVNGGGSDSQFGALTLVKGGGFGATSGTGATGGSGGGGGIPSGAGGSATSGGQGNAGGAGFSSSSGTTRGAGGGGGAGAVGIEGTSGTGGLGGAGTSSYTGILSAIGAGQLVGSTYYIAGGGGGGSSAGTSTFYAGGYGGGGSGTGSGTVNATAGSANTGGGGGGGGTTSGVANSTGGAGGSGIVIVRYAK